MAEEEQGNSQQEAAIKAAAEAQKKAAEERAKVIAAEQKKYALTPDETKNLSEQLKLLAEQAVLAERIPNAYERGLKLTEIQIQREQTILESQGKRLELINEIAQLEAQLEGLRGQRGEKADADRKALILRIRDLNIVKERLDSIQRVTQQTADVFAEGFRDGTQAFLTMFGAAIPFIDKLTNLQKLEGYIKAFKDESKTAAGVMMLLGAAFEKVGSLGKMALDGFQIPILGIQVKGLTETFKEFEQAKVEAFKSFGPQDKFEASMQSIRAEMLKTAGVTEKDLRTAYGNLNKAGVAVTTETAKFTAQMQKLGVESDKTSKLIKTLETSYQAVVKTAVNGTKIIDDMRKMGQAMGVGASTLITTMGSLMPKIIGFGEKGPEIFKKIGRAHV